MRSKGFTLMEVMVALVIVGVLAGLAVPGYFRTVEQARSNEARTNLNIIHMGERLYRLNNGVYWGPGNTTIAATNTALSTEMSASYYDTVSITANGAVGYTARLTRNATMGGAGTKFFQYVYPSATAGKTDPDLSEGGAY